MKNILILTDFSDNARNAIQYGMALYDTTECAFFLLHVSPVTAHAGGEIAMYAPQEVLEGSHLKERDERMKILLSEIEYLPSNVNHTFEAMAYYDYFTDRVKCVVAEKNIDLIIMGTKGATGLKAVSIGSNTGDVLTKVKCPVLVVPENARFTKPKEIAFPTDYYLNYKVNTLKDVKELAEIHNSAIRILYIYGRSGDLSPAQFKNQEFLQYYFSEIGHSFHMMKGEKLEAAVQEFTESKGIDLIVMVAKNLNILQRVLFRPRVEKLSYHIKIPFLILHEQ
jgi:nucleotide-binding universal stress UspA family protein